MSQRTSWDDTLLAMCRLLADSRADCRRSKHAAIVFEEETKDIVSLGYNGLASGCGSCLDGDCPRGLIPKEGSQRHMPYDSGPSQCEAVHAEVNALLRAGISRTRGRTLYVTGEPCHACSVVIRGAGIARLVTPESRGT